MANEIVFGGHGLRDLAQDCRHAALAVRREIDRTVWKIGLELAEAAKEIAGQHSQRVASTIKTRALPGMLVISAGSDDVPIAALWEKGNKGDKDSARVVGVWFRHPVFGNRDVWVNQRRYPFLRPAEEADRARIKAEMDRTFDRALAPYRLKPEGV